MKNQLLEKFKEACFEFGDFLAEKKIRCHYFIGSPGHNGGYQHFSMYVGCVDGAEVKVFFDERAPEYFLRAFKNGRKMASSSILPSPKSIILT